jgi:hypothetical protein
MIEVLLAHRSYPEAVMRKAVDRALALGAINPATVELLARHLSLGDPVQPRLLEVGELARYDRPLPNLADYDALCGCGVAS